MPELPEVEHARRRFLAMAGEQKIRDAHASDTIVVTGQSLAAWRDAIVGRRVEGAERIGKNVLVRLSGEHALWFHLGMTGRVVRAGAEGERLDETTGLPRFTRWWLETPIAKVCLADARRLGRTHAGAIDDVRRISKISELGADALAVRDAAALRACIGSARTAVKAALMDQARIAGLGNIQATEALWLAKIHPETPVPSLTDAQWSALADAIAASLERALESMNGLEELVYVEAGGPNPFVVYDREGEKCPRCGTAIVREVARGRASYLCPKCQRLRRIRG